MGQEITNTKDVLKGHMENIFLNKVSLCGPGCPGTHSIDLASHELTCSYKIQVTLYRGDYSSQKP